MLNTGRGFSDEFEFELENYSAKSGSKLKQQYKEWTSTMRKEGTAFFKSVKDKVCVIICKGKNIELTDIKFKIIHCLIIGNILRCVSAALWPTKLPSLPSHQNKGKSYSSIAEEFSKFKWFD